ncbi:Threonyl/alanyl tRNA synthetase, class II-like, putative editing domain [Pseudocohnilembus persalinus]|uniref:Probable threonine--tRNA ligase, cytoplasmic n=1 Tax=Pseudocohnilembus persalinus TaxID=266149 RepID=A0A0V0QS16_PSEPJ|nr:Threonyl/alanyl tRNA synthetase, class II-like, putative editing domain [Pseudocohnilembus persalinus]|eukprot:KRX04919.1 Threonyl/alanyl tRNA synthetase, class II-like, putative editing domain [Pseudocohnilembus persalinus]
MSDNPLSQEANQNKRELERTKETTSGSIKSVGKIGGEFTRQENPPFLKERDAVFQKALDRMKSKYEQVEKVPITITLKDGKQIEGKAFETCAQDICKKISNSLLDNTFAAKVYYSKRYDLGFGQVVDADKEEEQEILGQDGEKEEEYEIFDLHRPLEGDCKLELLGFEDKEGHSTFNHSAAHVLGNVIEYHYGAHLCIGPPLKTGFYYDSYMGNEKVHITSYEKIEKMALELSKKKLPFERAYLTKQEALELFKHNPFKVQLIQNKVPDEGFTSAYRCGSLVDLCTGPHLPNTGRIKSFKVIRNAASYWLGNNKNDDLQRVYGVAFPKAAMLKEYLRIQEELAKRDHRNIGQQYDLFSFNQMAPGCAFFYPKGAAIYNKLMEMLKHQYRIRGYQEVITPNLYDAQLWKISGHWSKYKENMFLVQGDNEDEQHGFKPMNCPGHCLMFDMKHVSYRDLPLRFADFGVLHRNELSGALSGLTRVRRFQQDDGHIFCTLEQVEEEILGVLKFINYVYDLFGFKFTLGLSTRPDNFLGQASQWDYAEEALKNALQKFGKPFKINPKDGAFYGPKIDIELFDAFDRGFQCGTIQLDFQLPIRFNLQYKAAEGKEQILKNKENPVLEEVPLLPREKEVKKQMEEEYKSGKVNKDGRRNSLTQVLKNAVKKSSEDNIETSEDQSQNTIKTKEKKYQIENHQIKPGHQRPIIIHRAVIGSFERFLAILCEQTAGKWPFWLSPRQIILLPITKYQFEYAEKLRQRFIYEGYNCVVDKSCHKIDKMVRNAQVAQYNYMLCVGKKEEANGTVDIRDRDETKSIGTFTIEAAVQFFQSKSPQLCEEEIELKKKAFYSHNEQELSAYNEELQYKTFFNGEDGIEFGEKDTEIYNKVKDFVVEKSLYPNLFRWLQYANKKLGQQQEQQQEKKQE